MMLKNQCPRCKALADPLGRYIDVTGDRIYYTLNLLGVRLPFFVKIALSGLFVVGTPRLQYCPACGFLKVSLVRC